jgi:putative ABC transport system permease protein
MLKDLQYAVRLLLKHRGPTTAAVVALALGMGANAAVFSTVDALLFRPLALADLDRLVAINEAMPRRGIPRNEVSPANFLDWAKTSRSFEAMAATSWWDINLTGGGDPERVQGFQVSASFFRTLGVTPMLGRGFREGEDQPGHERVAVLSHALWVRRFGADPSILGRTIQLDSIPYAVVGVAPERFSFPMSSELWAPLAFDAETAAARGSHYLDVVGRLKPSVTVEQARSEMQLIAAQLEKQYPQWNTGESASVVPLVEGVIDEGNGPFLAVLQGTTLLVLLIGCANVANLLLARGASRQKELALRAALGASRGRLTRQLLTESVVLALVGAGVSLLVASIGIDLIRDSMPATIRRFIYGWNDIDVDGRVFAFTAGAAILAGLVFGTAPAWQASRTDVSEALKEGGRTAAVPGRARLRGALVVAEVALALVLLVAAGLLVRGSFRMLHENRGFDEHGVMTMGLALPEGKYAEPNARRQFFRDLVARASAVPGVASAAAVSHIPFGGSSSSNTFAIEGQPPPDPGNRPSAHVRVVTPDYFATMRIPLVRGRRLDARDTADVLQVAVISELMAKRFWPDQDPIGRRFKIGSLESNGPWITVVGVVGDVMHHWFNRLIPPTFYRPFEQSPRYGMALVARVRDGDPSAASPMLREQVRAVDRDQAVYRVLTMRQLIADGTIGLSYMWIMMSVFALIAVVLAAVGVYAVMAYAVTQRTQEFGVRLALGARAVDVLGLVFRHTLSLAAIGVAIGLVGAFGLGKVLAANLFGVVAMDVSTFVAVAVGLAGVAAIAGYLPSRRATRVDPAIALRHE